MGNLAKTFGDELKMSFQCYRRLVGGRGRGRVEADRNAEPFDRQY